MLPLILQRIVATIPVMGVVALTVFALLHLTPGDPAEIIAGDYATPQDIAKIRAGLGLDTPVGPIRAEYGYNSAHRGTLFIRVGRWF